MHKRIHMQHNVKMCISMWIMWITKKKLAIYKLLLMWITFLYFIAVNLAKYRIKSYLPSSCSPIFTTSPAPIVISRSPGSAVVQKISLDLVKGREVFAWSTQLFGSSPEDPRKKFPEYRFLLPHRCQPELHGQPG